MTILCAVVIIILQLILLIRVCKKKRVTRDFTTYTLERILIIFLCLEVILYWWI